MSNSNIFEPVYDIPPGAVIKVIGVGGGGCNALNHMVSSNHSPEQHEERDSRRTMGEVEFFSVNTDAQVLRSEFQRIHNTVQIGNNVTKGLGAGADPNKGYQAAVEDRDALLNIVTGADMVFIAAGMGGGTGTGAAPVIAEIAKEQGALTVAIVTKPFSFEGPRRSRIADAGIKELSKHVDSLIIIQNDKLSKVLPKKVKLKEAFGVANDVLRNAVIGLTDMITFEGIINVDFADVQTVMSEMGRAMMGTGVASGENRAENAAKEAVASPLLEDVDLSGAKGILVNISSGYDIELEEVDIIMDQITSYADPDAVIVFGAAYDEEMEGKIRVTLVATGIGQPEEEIVTHTRSITQRREDNRVVGGNTHVSDEPSFKPLSPTEPKVTPFDKDKIFSPESMAARFMTNGK